MHDEAIDPEGEAVLIVLTCAGLDEGRQVCRILLERRLIAGANLMPEIVTLYSEEGRISESTETVVFIRSVRRSMQGILTAVQDIGLADVELSVIDSEQLNPSYRRWILSEISFDGFG